MAHREPIASAAAAVVVVMAIRLHKASMAVSISTAVTLTLVAVSISTAVSFYKWRRRWGDMESRVRELEKSVGSALEKCAAERRGRVRAQQALREALAQPQPNSVENTCYPMRPIGNIQSCFSSRNGTPRQPLLVSLARARLIFDPTLVPPASLEGLGEYSHCWIIYVFHLNTDIEKLWREPSQSKFKAKVRVPRLKGGKMGVFATRSPHRPCPIGLTVAKVEAIQGHMIQLSGVDLVDGTPVLDIKPYLPYSDSIQETRVPNWVKEDSTLAVASVRFSDIFFSSITDCWKHIEKNSLYASADEFKGLIEQVLSWDIRSVSQRIKSDDMIINPTSDPGKHPKPHEESSGNYHLVLEGLDVSYRIDSDSNIVVEQVSLSSSFESCESKER